MVKRWLRGIGLAVFSLVFLAGCSGPIGTVLASMAGAGAMYGGQAFLNRTQEDVEAKILHRADRKKIVDAATASKRRQCEDLKHSILEFVCWKDLLEFHDTQHPETLVMELKRRARENRDVRSESILQP